MTGLTARAERDERAHGTHGRGAHGRGGRFNRARDRRARRRAASAALGRIGVPRSKLTPRDAGREAVIAVARAPMRTVLTSMGTVLAVGTAIATIGLSDSAAGAVTKTFNALRATVVTFTDNSQHLSPPDLTQAAEQRLDKLNGVVGAGLTWQLDNGQLFQVSRTAPTIQSGQSSIGLPVTVASPRALALIGAHLSSGRLYDAGLDQRGDPVVLLGSVAAQQLGITEVGETPAIFIGRTELTVIGVVDRAKTDPQALLGLIIPPGAAAAVGGQYSADLGRQIMVRTQQGAAQLIGRQGPLAIDPLHPSQVSASVPIDPTQLRASVNSSLSTLLLAIALIALGVGVVAIANTTLLSVIQRRAEIGLRRSVGAAPRHVAVMVVFEAVLTGAIGGLMGTSVGVLIISVVCASRGWVPVLDPVLLLAAPAVGAVAGLLAGLYPAWRASRVSPISALQR